MSLARRLLGGGGRDRSRTSSPLHGSGPWGGPVGPCDSTAERFSVGGADSWGRAGVEAGGRSGGGTSGAGASCTAEDGYGRATMEARRRAASSPSIRSAGSLISSPKRTGASSVSR